MVGGRRVALVAVLLLCSWLLLAVSVAHGERVEHSSSSSDEEEEQQVAKKRKKEQKVLTKLESGALADGAVLDHLSMAASPLQALDTTLMAANVDLHAIGMQLPVPVAVDSSSFSSSSMLDSSLESHANSVAATLPVAATAAEISASAAQPQSMDSEGLTQRRRAATKQEQQQQQQPQQEQQQAQRKAAEASKTAIPTRPKESLLVSVSRAGARSGVISLTKNTLEYSPLLISGQPKLFAQKVGGKAVRDAGRGAVFKVVTTKVPQARAVIIYGSIAYKVGSVCWTGNAWACGAAAVTQTAKFASYSWLGSTGVLLVTRNFWAGAVVYGVGQFFIDLVFDQVEHWTDYSQKVPF